MRAGQFSRPRRYHRVWPAPLPRRPAKPATPLLSLRWTFRAKRACVVITDAEPDRLAPLTPPAPMGLRGVWVVAARCCASPPARCCADALERSFACPSANLRAPSRRGLRPRSVRRQPAAVSPRGERTRSRRGCWHCCADRAAPRSPPSRAPPAGNRTRCAPSWPPWCARGSGSGWSRRKGTASRVSDCCRQGFRRCHECAECVAMRGHSTNPAAIEAEIAHLRSLALDALRRHWRMIFGRTPPADLSKDLLGRTPRYARETCSSSRSAGATAGNGSDDGLPVFEDDRCGRRLVKRSR